MFRYAVVGLICLVASTAWAQQAPPQAETPGASSPPAAAVEPSKAIVTMEAPMPGDHWTYQIRDEITATVAATRTGVITEVTPTEISTRIDTLGNSTPGQIVFDRSWNAIILDPGNIHPTTAREFNRNFRSARPGIFNATPSTMPLAPSGNDPAVPKSPDRRP